jgi:polysaccharide biosynthesis transport protein
MPGFTSPYADSSAGADGVQREPPLFVQGVPLKELFGVIRRHIWLVLAIVLLALVSVAWRKSLQVPTYRATALVRLADSRRAMTAGIESESQEEVIGRYTDEILSQIEVLQGRTVLGVAVDRAGLRLLSETADFPTGLLSDVQIAPEAEPHSLSLGFLPNRVIIRTQGHERHIQHGATVNVDGIQFTLPSEPPRVDSASLVVIPREDAVDFVAGGFRAVPREGTDVIEVTFTSADSLIAKRVANAVAEAFQEYDARRAQDRSRRRRSFLENQLRGTDSLLAAAQNELSAFRGRVQGSGLNDRSSAQQVALMDLDVRREELAASRRMYGSLFNAVLRSSSEERRSALSTLLSAPEIAANPAVAPLYTQIVRYEAERDQLLAGPLASTTENADVRRLNALISATEGKLVDAVRSHIASLDARIGSLDELRARRSAEAQRLPVREAEEERLMQNVASIGRAADQLRAELHQARMAEAVQAGRVEIVDLAPSAVPTGRSGRMTLILAGLLGLFLGSGCAFAAEALNTSIRRPQEISYLLRVPRLAIVPRIETQNRSGLRRLASATFGGSKDNRSQDGTRPTFEVNSRAEEAFRTLRANLIFAARSNAIKTLVVTSPSPGEGKSTTVSNLAVSFARQGFRVLLIDADLRRPRLHEVFSVPRDPGFSSLLGGHCLLAESIRTTPVDGLYLMPSGARLHSPSELLSGELMRGVLAELRDRFDLLMLDTPPVLAAAETAMLAAEADAVLLVVRAGRTDRGAAEEAMQQLVFAGARIAGAVLNDPNTQLPRYGRYDPDSYGSRAGTHKT